MIRIARPTILLCADWSADASKRAVYIAHVGERKIWRLACRSWSVEGVLDAAIHQSKGASALVAFDAPLGVPKSYFETLAQKPRFKTIKSFPDLVKKQYDSCSYFRPITSAAQWGIATPFFAVPGGEGAFREFTEAASKQSVELRRNIEVLTHGKSVFVRSGIPGSVGSAACDLWQGLGRCLAAGRKLKIWPFEGELGSLLQPGCVTVGEIYPRASYSTALLDEPAGDRCLIDVAKTRPDVRSHAVDALQSAQWIKDLKVSIEDCDAAKSNEDDFDACLSTAALLRTVLSEEPSSCFTDRVAEGGILGIGGIDLRRPRKVFGASPKAAGRLRTERARPQGEPETYRCPIEGCEHVYNRSRAGWDSHVASMRNHLNWHPEITNGRDRKALFRNEFPRFFG